uniref:Uncharacterized protein n=1 Tax=Glossina pallidipes TaxID=7398 RepID=A0A1B0A6T3_GLOPL
MNIREKKQTSTELNVTKQNVTNEKPRESLQNPHEHSKSSAHKAPKIINLSRTCVCVMSKAESAKKEPYFLVLLLRLFGDIFSAFPRRFWRTFYKLHMKHDIVDLLCSRVDVNERLKPQCLILGYVGRKLKWSSKVVNFKTLNKGLAVGRQRNSARSAVQTVWDSPQIYSRQPLSNIRCCVTEFLLINLGYQIRRITCERRKVTQSNVRKWPIRSSHNADICCLRWADCPNNSIIRGANCNRNHTSMESACPNQQQRDKLKNRKSAPKAKFQSNSSSGQFCVEQNNVMFPTLDQKASFLILTFGCHKIISYYLATLMQGRGWLGMHGSWKLTIPISCPSQISGAPGKNWSQCVVSPFAGISMQIASSYRSGILRLHSSGFTITAWVSTMSSSCSSPKPTTTQLTGSSSISTIASNPCQTTYFENLVSFSHFDRFPKPSMRALIQLRSLYTLAQGRGTLPSQIHCQLTMHVSLPSQINGAPLVKCSQCVLMAASGTSMQIILSVSSELDSYRCLLHLSFLTIMALRFEDRKIVAICLSYNLWLSSILSIVLLEDVERTHLGHILQNHSLIFFCRRHMLLCCSD